MINSPISVDPRGDRSDSSHVWALAGPIRRGVVTDISASGSDATASGGVLNTRDECWGEGWRFPGKTGKLRTTTAISLGTWADGLTIAALAKPESTGGVLLSVGPSVVGYLQVTTTSVACRFYVDAGVLTATYSANTIDGLEHLYVGVWDPTSNTVILYVDGEPVATSVAGSNNGTARSAASSYVGAFDNNNTVNNVYGDIHAAYILSGVKSAAWVKAQWNRLAPACRLYIPPYVASLPNQIPLGTVVGPAWIPHTPIYVASGTVVVELETIDGVVEVVARATATADMTIGAKGALNGCLGPAAELSSGEYVFRSYRSGVFSISMPTIASSPFAIFYSGGEVAIYRRSGAIEASYPANTVTAGWHEHRIRLDKNASGGCVTWWMDGKLMVPESGSNPTARWAFPIPTTQRVTISGTSTNKLALTGLAKHPTWSLT